MSDGKVKRELSGGRRAVKISVICVLSVLAAFVLTVIGYVLYVVIQYNRIEDNFALQINNNKADEVQLGTEYSILTYNIGFGAYSPEYSFFMDTGVMKDGKKTTGKYGKGISYDDVKKNTDGSLALIKAQNTDFALVQEADEKADRSYKINQKAQIESLDGYGSLYAENFHSAYLFYPFGDPHGKSNAGIVTLSKFNVESSARRSFPLDTGFAKFFDLDRCFSVSRLPISGGKEFVLINLHMSAYDKGGTIRALQLDMLNSVLKDEFDKGNYVIAGGDFNHVIAPTDFATTQGRPEWVATLSAENIATNYSIVTGTNAPTCRGADIPYTKGVNYTVVIDGFLVSNNITATASVIDSDFAFSDHNPVHMNFTLN